jgi:hypothetical protein
MAMTPLVSEYGPADLQVMHDRAIGDASDRYGRVTDLGWRVAIRNDGSSLHSYFETPAGKAMTYSTML